MSAVSTVDVDLPKEIFDVQVNIPLIHQVVVAQQAAARQGTHDTKSRGEVSGGGKKPYRQKGTGRARQGSIRAPQYVGGGTVHGPTPRSYEQKVPKKMKAAALRGALSDRARTGRLHVVETFGIDGAPSTKAAVAALQSLTTRNRVLVVLDRDDQVTLKSLRNVPNLHLLPVDQLNTYDVVKSDDVVFTKAAYDLFVTTRATSGGETVKLSAAVVDSEAPQAAAPKKAAAKKAPAKKAAAEAETTESTETDATEEDAK